MKCEQCGAANSDENKFCPQCGCRLDPNWHVMKDYLATHLGPCVRNEVASLLKDQKVVEVEIAEAVATRISSWGRLAGYFLGVCGTLMFLALGFVGVKSIVDLGNLTESTQKSVASEFEKTLKAKYEEAAKELNETLVEQFSAEIAQQLKRVKEQGALLEDETNNLKNQLEAARKGLNTRVDNIEKKVDHFTVEQSAAVSSRLKTELETQLQDYEHHLKSVGYVADFEGDVRVVTHLPTPGFYASYDPHRRVIAIDARVASSNDIDLTDWVLREYGHCVFSELNKHADNTEQGLAVKSGLVTFFACSYRKKALLGGKGAIAIDISKEHKSSEVGPGRESAMREGSTVWGSLFWAIRTEVGQDTAERALISSWSAWKLQELASIDDFAKQIIAEVESLRDAPTAEGTLEILRRWGLRVE